MLMTFPLLVLIGMQERQKPSLSFGDVPGDDQERGEPSENQWPQKFGTGSCDEHHEKNHSANEQRRPQVGLQNDQSEKHRYHGDTVEQSHQESFAFRLKFCVPPRNKNYRGELRQL